MMANDPVTPGSHRERCRVRRVLQAGQAEHLLDPRAQAVVVVRLRVLDAGCDARSDLYGHDVAPPPVLVVPSSNVTMTTASAARSLGTLLCRYASPVATEQSCM